MRAGGPVDGAMIAAMAEDILGARAFRPLTPLDGPRDLARAYAEQAALAAHLVAGGHRLAPGGWKIAANAAPLMAHFGLSEPVSAAVFADQIHDSPATLSRAGYHSFAYEPEIAAVMAADLDPAEAPFATDRVQAAIARFVPAFELLDMRGVEMPKAHLPDVVAQGISNAGAVIGGPGLPPEALDPAAIETVVTLDGAEIARVTGGAPQPPLEATVWIANHLAARGQALRTGQIVLLGTHAPIRGIPAGGRRLRVAMSGLGAAELVMTG